MISVNNKDETEFEDMNDLQDLNDLDDPEELKSYNDKLKVEACIFFATEGITIDDLIKVLPHLTRNQLKKILNNLIQEYEENEGALRLSYISSSLISFVVDPELMNHSLIEKFTAGKDLNPSELKTLSFICYFQPVEEAEIIELVGRGSQKSLKSLFKRQFITFSKDSYEILNEKGESIDRKVKIYSTTSYLAKYLGVDDDPEIIKELISQFM